MKTKKPHGNMLCGFFSLSLQTKPSAMFKRRTVLCMQLTDAKRHTTNH